MHTESGHARSPVDRVRNPARVKRAARLIVRTSAKPRSTSHSRARLSRVLLGYFLAIIVVITLTPFSFRIPSHFEVITTGTWFDGVTNVLLFVPLGFLYPLTRQGRDSSPLHVLIVGALLSTAIETAQLFDVHRYASVLDVATNAAGAGLGALLLAGVNRRIRASSRLAGRLSLEIPLMGLIYLTVPLLLTASLSALDDPRRLVALLPLGLLGARLLSAVQEHHFGPAGVFNRRSTALVTAAWAALGAFPVVLRYPVAGSAGIVLVALASLPRSSRQVVHGPDRRFETDVLRSTVPFVGAYFFLAIAVPLTAGIGHWHISFGLTGLNGSLTQQLLHLLAPVASTTVLAYMLAEARGRRELPYWMIARRVVVECGALALLMEVSRGFQRHTGASVAQLALTAGAAFVGAGIYHSQRERIRTILVRDLA